VWIVQWAHPPCRQHVRSFPTEELAKEWLERLRTDPSVAAGEGLQREIQRDRARRTAHDMMLRNELPLTAAERKKRAPPKRSPYRPKSPPVAKLGSIGHRRSANGLRWYVNGWDKDGIRRNKGGFASERAALAWRDAKTRELALKEVETIPPIVERNEATALRATIERQDATIRDLRATIGGLRKDLRKMAETVAQGAAQNNRHMVDLKRGLRINNMDSPRPTRRDPQG
jgi:hypothetical protein